MSAFLRYPFRNGATSKGGVYGESPIHLIGGNRFRQNDFYLVSDDGGVTTHPHFERQLRRTLLWFTYRSGFPPIATTHFTSDAGWGCMHRSGQMLLGAVLLRHLLPTFPSTSFPLCSSSSTPAVASTSYDAHPPSDDLSPKVLRKIIGLFADRPDAPFSLHSIAGASRKEVGEWLGPSMVAHALRDLMEEHQPLDRPLCISVARDLLVCVDQVYAEIGRAAAAHSISSSVERKPVPKPHDEEKERTTEKNGSVEGGVAWVPLLLVIPVRLGLSDLIDACYQTNLLSMYQDPHFMGVIGGRPRASLFFVGAQDDNVLYLDPHTVQLAVDTGSDEFPIESYLVSSLQTMPLRNLDSSMALAFYFETKAEFELFCEEHKKDPSETPFFSVMENSFESTERWITDLNDGDDFDLDSSFTLGSPPQDVARSEQSAERAESAPGSSSSSSTPTVRSQPAPLSDEESTDTTAECDLSVSDFVLL